MTTLLQPEQIRSAVRDYYAERAAGGQSCCGPESGNDGCGCTANSFHSADLLTGLPEDIASFSLGCGDAVSLAHLQPDEVVVDLGSGGGLECFIAARQVGPNGRAVGIDMTPAMLAKAWANTARLKLDNVEFRQGYLEALPVADASADVVISNCVINLSPDKAQVFREMYRVLKPSGRIAVSDIVTQGTLSAEVKQNMTLWGACYAGALEVQDYVAGLARAGFVDIEVKPKGEVAVEIEQLAGQIFSAAVTAAKPA
ncbi:MAG TPA: arsenite methyltransferase [Caldilineaceae bacterium]|nr:arsenite methyltransferase [Caldilineaceae bacterium]